jgi:hypothetical protein
MVTDIIVATVAKNRPDYIFYLVHADTWRVTQKLTKISTPSAPF